MTIESAIQRVDSLKPNQFTAEQKILWLSQLDGLVYHTILAAHDGAPERFDGYAEDVDTATVLLIPEPFDDVYLYWLQGMIDRENGEINRYNNSAQMFQTAYDRFSAWYTRTHATLPRKSWFRF